MRRIGILYNFIGKKGKPSPTGSNELLALLAKKKIELKNKISGVVTKK